MIEHVNDVYALRPGLFRGGVLNDIGSEKWYNPSFTGVLLCHPAKMRFGEQFSDAKGELICDWWQPSKQHQQDSNAHADLCTSTTVKPGYYGDFFLKHITTLLQ